MVETQFKVTFPGWANWTVYKVAGRQQPYTVLKDGFVEFFSASRATVLNRIEADHVAVCPGCRVRWTALRSGQGESRDRRRHGRQMAGEATATVAA